MERKGWGGGGVLKTEKLATLKNHGIVRRTFGVIFLNVVNFVITMYFVNAGGTAMYIRENINYSIRLN